MSSTTNTAKRSLYVLFPITNKNNAKTAKHCESFLFWFLQSQMYLSQSPTCHFLLETKYCNDNKSMFLFLFMLIQIQLKPNFTHHFLFKIY